MTLSQNHQVVVTVDGRPIGTFDTRRGGEVTGVVVKRRSGGMGPIKQSAGLPDYGDVTVSREKELARDHELYRRLVTRVGKAEMVVNDYTLDENQQRYGKPTTYVGKLLSLTPPDHDSTSAETDMFSLTMSVRSVA